MGGTLGFQMLKIAGKIVFTIFWELNQNSKIISSNWTNAVVSMLYAAFLVWEKFEKDSVWDVRK